MMTWRREEPGHQPWYWPSSSGILEYFSCRLTEPNCVTLFNSSHCICVLKKVLTIIPMPSGDYPEMPIHPSPCTTHSALTPRGQPQRLEAHKSPHYGLNQLRIRWVKIYHFCKTNCVEETIEITFCIYLSWHWDGTGYWNSSSCE